MASDALGLSDIGKVIGPDEYDKTQSDDYVRYEDGEEIYFLIMTKSDEYCFTNLALIHVDGDSAVSSKRSMKRYPYYKHQISDVVLETAGKIDLDVEIKFNLGGTPMSIDIARREVEAVKDLYKALLNIAEVMDENEDILHNAHQSVSQATSVLQHVRLSQGNAKDSYKEVNEYVFDWLESSRDKYVRKDYGEVFEKYINN